MKKLFATLFLVFFFTASALAGININTADQQTLETLPGIGAAKAKAIIEYRYGHGNFNSLDELTNVKGIGNKLLSQIKELIEVK